MKQDISLSQLLDEIKAAVEEKEKAEHARVRAEEKKRKAQCTYTHLMDIFRNKEFIIT